MTCRDFEQAWNELMDAGDASSGWAARRAAQSHPAMAERERALLDHAAECSECRQVAARYQALRRAIRAWGPAPAAPGGFADRIIASIEARAPSARPIYGTRRRVPRWPIGEAVKTLAAIVAAGIVLALVLQKVNSDVWRLQRNGPPAVVHNTPFDDGRESDTVADGRALDVALAEATAATWDLARSASEPAARLGRQVLGPAAGPDQDAAPSALNAGAGPVGITISVLTLDSLPTDTAAAGAVLQQVSDRLTTGVRPLAETARHAFGFLLVPAVPKPQVPVHSPAQKGA